MTYRGRAGWGGCGALVVLLIALFTSELVGRAASVPELLKAEGFTEAKLIKRDSDNMFCVAVKINGKELRLLADTGAGLTIISRQAAERCGLPIEGNIGATKGINGVADMEAGQIKVDSFTVEGVEWKPTPVLISNFHFQYLFGNGYDGLLGLAAMKTNNVVMGFAPRCFLFNPQAPASMALSSQLKGEGETEILLRFDRGTVRYNIPMMVNGVSLHAILDTGTQFTVIDQSIVDRAKMAYAHGRLISSGVDGKSSVVRVIAPRSINISTYRLNPVWVTTARLGIFQEKLPTGKVDALLGVDVFSGLSPVIDIGNDWLYLKLPTMSEMP